MAITINGTTGVTGVDGSASTPALQGSDTNTGVSFGTDIVNINTGGSTRATVDADGDLGIGTTSPSHKLHVVSSGTDTAFFKGRFVRVDGAASSDSPRVNLSLDGTDKTSMMCNRTDSSLNLETLTSAPIKLTTNSSERARIDASGRLLAGRTNNISVGGDASDHCFEQLTDNGYALTVHCDKAQQRGIGVYYTTGKTAEAVFAYQIGSTWKTIIRSDGDLENANNSYGSISDVSFKENIVDAKSQWNDIKNIKVRNYNFKESTGQQTHTQIGVIAQELETVSPKLVRESEGGMKTVSYSVLYMKAIKALQEAMAKIETLETKVAALEAA